MSWIRRIKHRLQPIAGGIDQTWSHDGAVGIRGWVIHKNGKIKQATVEVDGVGAAVTNWHPRPDIKNMFPWVEDETLRRCGFWVQVPRTARHRITLTGTDGRSQGRMSWCIDGTGRPEESADAGRARKMFQRFIDIVNERRLNVLEVGSRIVAPGSDSKRSLFHGAGSYTGFDYYTDDNTDVIGDAHRLSEYFSDRKFDAVFSYSVLEHLAMPWVFPIEINRVLTPGGLTFHHTHFAWPQHEQPWDFWRFTDAGLKVLFSGTTGFEVTDSGMFEPLHMYLDRSADGLESFPEFPAYGGSVILAKKVSDCPVERGVWDVDVTDVYAGSEYPRQA